MQPERDIKKRIAEARKSIRHLGGEYVPWSRSFEYAGDLNEIVAAVRGSILTHDPVAARDLMAEFFSRDKVVFESCDDSSGAIGEVFREAAEVFALASRAANDPATGLAIVRKLLEKDDYGVRSFLIKGIPRFLDKPHRERLLAEWWKAVPGPPDGYASRHALVQIEQLAEAGNDPVLYERAVSYGRDLEDFPILATRVARQYLLKEKF